MEGASDARRMWYEAEEFKFQLKIVIAVRLEPLRNRLHFVVLRSRLPVFDCGAPHRLGVDMRRLVRRRGILSTFRHSIGTSYRRVMSKRTPEDSMARAEEERGMGIAWSVTHAWSGVLVAVR